MRGTPVYAVGKQISLPRDDGIGHVGDVFYTLICTHSIDNHGNVKQCFTTALMSNRDHMKA